jgi:DNA-binding response OmpR family regulator
MVELYGISKLKEKKGVSDMSEDKLKVLVVDDETEISGFIKSSLERRGYEVFVAGSAGQALPIIKAENPQVMLLDINLPDMKGAELLKIVRQFNSTIKVIVVSGHELDSNQAKEFKDLGMFKFMCKPINFPELVEVIAQKE